MYRRVWVGVVQSIGGCNGRYRMLYTVQYSGGYWRA
jgi:hypothetical protein